LPLTLPLSPYWGEGGVRGSELHVKNVFAFVIMTPNYELIFISPNSELITPNYYYLSASCLLPTFFICPTLPSLFWPVLPK
jgi:hypothetical protein